MFFIWYLLILIPLTLLLILAGVKLDEFCGLNKFVPVPYNLLFFIVFMATGLGIVIWSYSYLVMEGQGSPSPYFGKLRHLVKTGPYAIVRHPSVIGKLLGVMSLGFLFQSFSFTFIIVPLLLIGSLLEKVFREEKKLKKRWGREYLEYKSNTPFIIPYFNFLIKILPRKEEARPIKISLTAILLGILLGLSTYYYLVNHVNTLEKSSWRLSCSPAAKIMLNDPYLKLKLGLSGEKLFLSSFSRIFLTEAGTADEMVFDFDLCKEGVLELILGKEEGLRYVFKLSRYGNIESGLFGVTQGRYYSEDQFIPRKFTLKGWHKLSFKISENKLIFYVDSKPYAFIKDQKADLSQVSIRCGVLNIAVDNIKVRLKDGRFIEEKFQSKINRGYIAVFIIFLSVLSVLGAGFILRILHAQLTAKCPGLYGILYLFFLVAILVLIELAVRTTNLNLKWRPDWKVAIGMTTLAADNDLFWTPATSAEGSNVIFRGIKYPINKSRGIYRIVCLGDSTTWGQGIEDAADTYPMLLEKLLNNQNEKEKFEVINAGVPGYTSFQGLLFLKKYILSLSPDLVTVRFCANDLQDNAGIGIKLTDREYWEMLRRAASRPGLLTKLQVVFRKSRLYVGLEKFIFSLMIRTRIVKPRPRVTVDEYLDNLKGFVNVTKENNIKLVFLYETFAKGYTLGELLRNNPYYQGLKAVADNNNIPLVDLVTPFERRRHEDIFWDEVHPTVLGHKIIATEVYNTLKKR